MLFNEFETIQNFVKTIVALCCTMWHYIYVLFLQNTEKMIVFKKFDIFKKITKYCKFGCGTM